MSTTRTNVTRIIKANVARTIERPGLLDTVKRAVGDLEHEAASYEAAAKQIRQELLRFQQWASSPSRPL